MRKILIDLNIILDMLSLRDDHEAAIAVFDRCSRKLEDGYLCAHEVTTLAYFLGKDSTLRSKRSSIIRRLLDTLQTIPATGQILRDALDSPIQDYEDAVIEVSALTNGIEFIVTRDLRDFSNSRVPVLTAREYLALSG
jgi:predicted nucleic acid-binding protein